MVLCKNLAPTTMRDKKGKFISTGRFKRYSQFSKKVKIPCLENKNQNKEEFGFGFGRRIVELGYFAEQMKSCQNCSTPLYLHCCKKRATLRPRKHIMYRMSVMQKRA